MENKKTAIPKYNFTKKTLEEIISEITENIKKIKEPEPEGKVLLEMFKCKYNIAEDVFSNKDFYKTMREILKLQNNGVELPLCSKPNQAIQNWLAGSNPFSQSSSGYSPKQKIIAWMIYMKFSKEEINEFLNRYDYGELYVLDWFDVCAIITYKFGKDYEFFWDLQNRKNELFDKANRIILTQEKDTDETPAIKVDFGSITTIEGNEKSLVWFINKHKHEFGRTHLSVYLWLDELLSRAGLMNVDQRKLMFTKQFEEEEIKKIIGADEDYLRKIKQSKDKKRKKLIGLIGADEDCLRKIKQIEEEKIKELIGADEDRLREIGREYIQKYSTSIYGKEKNERKKESCQEAIHNLCARYDIGDSDMIDKLYALTSKGQYEEFEKKLGNFLLIQIISRELNANISEKLSKELIKLRQSIPDFDTISEDKVGEMIDRTKSISRTFVIKNILYHMSTDFIEEQLLHQIMRDRFNKKNSTISNENIANMIESSINENFEDFGFRSLNPEYRADTLLLIAIHNVDYRSVLFQEDGDEQPYPFRKFVIGNSQDQYSAVKIEMRV